MSCKHEPSGFVHNDKTRMSPRSPTLPSRFFVFLPNVSAQPPGRTHPHLSSYSPPSSALLAAALLPSVILLLLRDSPRDFTGGLICCASPQHQLGHCCLSSHILARPKLAQAWFAGALPWFCIVCFGLGYNDSCPACVASGQYAGIQQHRRPGRGPVSIQVLFLFFSTHRDCRYCPVERASCISLPCQHRTGQSLRTFFPGLLSGQFRTTHTPGFLSAIGSLRRIICPVGTEQAPRCVFAATRRW